ncbi:MAG: glycosyltransferase [Candidatus Sumerlaeia bacterium]|nr:glycosyltransferase [Candidatus Sumerlaeia bacterium]
MTPKRPHVVRVITWLPVGGIERRIVAVLPRLRDMGWDVSVVCIRERGELAREVERAGIPLEVVPFGSRLSPGGIRRLAEIFRERGADVVHSHMYRSNVPATVAGRLAGVRAIFGQVHNVGTWETPRQRLADMALSRLRRGTIAVSKAVQRDVMASLRLPASRVPLVYNGIDTEAFRPDGELRAKVRGELGATADTTVVLVPARLHPQKNPLGMLRAFQAARGATPERRALLVYAGAGDEEEALRRAIAEARLGRDAVLLGKRDDMAAVYNGADLVALPSFKEGFSNAVLEALACGRPVLASDAGGNAEAVDGPALGWIHPVGDAAALERDLSAALAEGPALAGRAEACRARALEFSVEAMVRRLHELYSEGLGTAP